MAHSLVLERSGRTDAECWTSSARASSTQSVFDGDSLSETRINGFGSLAPFSIDV
jgi:hypothetical protein